MCADDRTGARRLCRRKREDLAQRNDVTAYIDDFRRVSGVDMINHDDGDGDENENDDAGPCKKRDIASQNTVEVAAPTQIVSLRDRRDARLWRFLARPIPAAVRVADLWRELTEIAPWRPTDRYAGCCDRFALAALRHSTEWRSFVDAHTFGAFFERALARHFREWVDGGAAAAAAAIITSRATATPRSSGAIAETAEIVVDDDDIFRRARETERYRAGDVAEWLAVMPDHVSLHFPLAVAYLCARDATPDPRGDASRESATSNCNVTSCVTPTSTVRVQFGLAGHGFPPQIGHAKLARFAAWTVGRFARSLGLRPLLSNESQRADDRRGVTLGEMPDTNLVAMRRGAADARAWNDVLVVAIAPFLVVPGLSSLVAQFLD